MSNQGAAPLQRDLGFTVESRTDPSNDVASDLRQAPMILRQGEIVSDWIPDGGNTNQNQQMTNAPSIDMEPMR